MPYVNQESFGLWSRESHHLTIFKKAFQKREICVRIKLKHKRHDGTSITARRELVVEVGNNVKDERRSVSSPFTEKNRESLFSNFCDTDTLATSK